MHELTYKNSQTTKIPTQGVECAKFACAELGARHRGAIEACVKAYELSRIADVELSEAFPCHTQLATFDRFCSLHAF